ncbi:hypothetical protein BH10CYA1_BH10CYA1_50520 [soil metagenome]
MIKCEKLTTTIPTEWDVVIVGAGPAGAFAAFLLAQHASNILLVDKANFPRPKVCGCCINNAALNLLNQYSLHNLMTEQGAVPLEQLCLFEAHRSATVNLPGGYSLSRNKFDTALIKAGIDRGVIFLPGTTAQVLNASPSGRAVQLQDEFNTQVINAKIVLVADGLGGRSLDRHAEFDFITDANSRFGCGTIVDDAPDYYQPGRIYMACASGGYVGLVRLEDGRVDVAAALDRDFSRAHSGPAKAATMIMRISNLPVPESLSTTHWTGTEALTRKRNQIAAERVFVLGDSCGYAEPFTGEGIAWALTSGAGVIELAQKGLTQWSPSLIQDWHFKHTKMIKARQDRSIAIAHGLRNDTLRHFAIPMIASFPLVASSIIKYIANTKVAAAR